MIRLLRGRVALRPIDEPYHGLLTLPDMTADWKRAADEKAGIKAQASHRGIILGMGPPAQVNGHDVPHDFEIGNEVVYVYAHHERYSEGHVWEDGGPVLYVSQEEIQGVSE